MKYYKIQFYKTTETNIRKITKFSNAIVNLKTFNSFFNILNEETEMIEQEKAK